VDVTAEVKLSNSTFLDTSVVFSLLFGKQL